MYGVHFTDDADGEAFRSMARCALSHAISPQELTFVVGRSPSLFAPLPAPEPGYAMTAPRAYLELLQDVICHRAEDRFPLLYDVLWRLKHGEPELLSRASDPAVSKLSSYAGAVHRDIHKMHAFVRFHRRQSGSGDLYFAWFEPQHFVLRRAAPFFVDRFASMNWIIATPDGTASWDGRELAFGPALPKPEKLEDEVLGEVWQTYYRTIFNPARVNPQMMTREMPKKYWRNLPEAALIPGLVAKAQRRIETMDDMPDVPPRFAEKIALQRKPEMAPADALAALRAEAARCRACPLHRPATQTVFGEGPVDARLVFVGEQPGDSEDIAGRPFVGPAGQVFDRALSDAGIDRAGVYVTNAVKHFKFEPRGKRRIHSKPDISEVRICGSWLTQELDLLNPDLVVALGATAAHALSGRNMAVTKTRGAELKWPDGRRGLVTVHPSFLLRLPDKGAQETEYAKFVHDLKLAAFLIGSKRESVHAKAA
ncbi:MAG: UdgX family uracil-DNA binding protein [Alphaproteobacteria bacterium]|nr:UdgX family uracil-DNA binding protein [Alphaproteobacteria bacterium]